MLLGDFFGEDLLVNRYREQSAHALCDSVLLRFNKELISWILDKVPNVGALLKATNRSRKFVYKKKFSWNSEEEALYFITRKHEFFMIFSLIIPIFTSIALISIFGLGIASGNIGLLALGIIGLLIAIISGMWLWFDWGNDFYVVTNKRVLSLVKVALMYDSRQEAPLSTILATNVSSNQALQSIIDYGNVTVKTYTGSIQMLRARSPNQIVDFIYGLQAKAKEFLKHEELEEMEGLIRKRLGTSMDDEQISQTLIKQSIKPDRELTGWSFYFSNIFKVR